MNVPTVLQRTAACAALAASLYACAGASKQSFEPVVAPAVRVVPRGTARALLAFALRGPAAKNPHGPVTGFISPSTAFLVVKTAGKFAYVSPDLYGYKQFSASFSVPSGVDTIEVDLMYSKYSILSRGIVKQKMPAGVETPISIELHGVPTKVSLAIANQYPPVGKPATQQLHLIATDAAPVERIDRGTYDRPFTVKVQNSSPHVKINGLTFNGPADAGTIVYDGKSMAEPIFFTVEHPPSAYPSTTILFLANSFFTFPKVEAGDIALGRGDIVWFSTCGHVTEGPCSIRYLKPDGTVVIVGKAPWVQSLVEGPDGNLWFTEGEMKAGTAGPTIGRMTPSGKLTEFLIYKKKPHRDYGTFSIIVGRDEALWFTEPDAVGRITTDGRITQYPVKFSGISVPSDRTRSSKGTMVSFILTAFLTPSSSSTPTAELRREPAITTDR